MGEKVIFYKAEEKRQSSVAKKVISGILLGLAVTTFLANPVEAATGDSQEQNFRTRQDAEERQARQKQEDVRYCSQKLQLVKKKAYKGRDKIQYSGINEYGDIYKIHFGYKCVGCHKEIKIRDLGKRKEDIQ